MILSAKDLKDRLGHKNNSLKERNLPKPRPSSGRTEDDLDRNDKPAGPDIYIRDTTQSKRPGDINIPSDVKIPAMILSRLEAGPQHEIAELFGISQREVSHLKNGENTKPEEESIVDGALKTIRGEVINRLDESLAFLTPDKFANAKLGELTGAIQKLAGVQETLSPTKKEHGTSNVKVVIHAVARQEVNNYEIIEVGGQQ